MKLSRRKYIKSCSYELVARKQRQGSKFILAYQSNIERSIDGGWARPAVYTMSPHKQSSNVSAAPDTCALRAWISNVRRSRLLVIRWPIVARIAVRPRRQWTAAGQGRVREGGWSGWLICRRRISWFNLSAPLTRLGSTVVRPLTTTLISASPSVTPARTDGLDRPRQKLPIESSYKSHREHARIRLQFDAVSVSWSVYQLTQSASFSSDMFHEKTARTQKHVIQWKTALYWLAESRITTFAFGSDILL